MDLDPPRDVVDELWVLMMDVREAGHRERGRPADVVVVLDARHRPRPGLPRRSLKALKFLFVGGLIEWSVDALLEAYGLDLYRRGRRLPGDQALRLGDGLSQLDPRSRRAPRRWRGPEIEFVDGDLTTEEMAALYRADVLGLPDRGAGLSVCRSPKRWPVASLTSSTTVLFTSWTTRSPG